MSIDLQLSVQSCLGLITREYRRLTPDLSHANTLSRDTWNEIKQSDRVSWHFRGLITQGEIRY
jgi:hypothetical protein